MIERDDFDARNENDRYSDPCASEDEANVDLLVAFQVIRELRAENAMLQRDVAMFVEERNAWRLRAGQVEREAS